LGIILIIIAVIVLAVMAVLALTTKGLYELQKSVRFDSRGNRHRFD